MEQLIKLSEIFLSVERLPWQWTLFLPAQRDWSVDTEGAVLDTGDEDDPNNPIFAQAHGLVSVLSISALQDIVANARHQDPNIRVPRLMQAFEFYLDRDAFINFDIARSAGELP